LIRGCSGFSDAGQPRPVKNTSYVRQQAVGRWSTSLTPSSAAITGSFAA
jgi:hypothetical protein